MESLFSSVTNLDLNPKEIKKLYLLWEYCPTSGRQNVIRPSRFWRWIRRLLVNSDSGASGTATRRVESGALVPPALTRRHLEDTAAGSVVVEVDARPRLDGVSVLKIHFKIHTIPKIYNGLDSYIFGMSI